MENYLRDWREDAARKTQYDTAVFVGDKVLAITGSDVDALRLAQLHFAAGNNARALGVLSKHELVFSSAECRYIAAQCHLKQGKLDDALVVLGERTPSYLRESSGNSRRKLAPGDIHSRARGAKTGKKTTKQETESSVESESAEEATNRRFEAGMCFLRGLCHAKLNAFDIAKSCYMDAVRIDVQCFEAFDQLMKNALMSPDEEWDFLNSLNFDSVMAANSSTAQQAAELTRMLYVTRTSKYKNPQEFTTAIESLSTHYNLASNPDLLLSKAELLFTQCRFREALSLTQTILAEDQYNVAVLPVHLACLHELGEKNALFLLAHDFADRHPEEPATWLAVGVYYLSIGKIAEARRFFSKSSMMDPHFGPAWVGFAHTFAAEGEHDQAISAYSTAARLFQGTHLPQLFLGMQNLQNANMSLAREFLNVALGLCDSDPLLLNELGIVYYHENNIEQAIEYFNSALSIAQAIDADSRAYLSTRVNLGHAYRRVERYEDALEQFDEVLRRGGKDASVFSAKGLVLMQLGATMEAVTVLHEALAVNPQDAVANDLLAKALEESSSSTMEGGTNGEGEIETEFDSILEVRKREATTSRAKGKARRIASRQHGQLDAMDEEI